LFSCPSPFYQALENSKAWASQEHDKLVNKLKMALQDKDKTIEVRNNNKDSFIVVTFDNNSLLNQTCRKTVEV